MCASALTGLEIRKSNIKGGGGLAITERPPAAGTSISMQIPNQNKREKEGQQASMR